VNDHPFVVHELRYLFWAYTLIWLLLAGYLTFLLVRLSAVSRALRRLKEERGETSR
jgi:CcmD family protein